MGTVINTNIMSLNAQRNLGSSQGQLATSLERLSSGLRINSARDDAAGLAISERFTAQINGQNQAVRNANDGISFSQTAEGALDEVSNLLQRVRELAVQSANDTNSASDRRALNEEVQQAVQEVQRIATSTQFNDQNVLDGSLEDLVFQVGANRGQTISVAGVDARSSELGATVGDGFAITASEFATGGALAGLDGDSLAINGEEIDLSGIDSIGGVITEINNAFADTNVQAARAEQAVVEVDDFAAGSGGTLTLNGANIDIDAGMSTGDFVNAINDERGQSGVAAVENTAGNIVLTASEDIAFSIESDGTGDVEFGGLTDEGSDSFLRGIELSTDVGESITVTGDEIAELGIDFENNPDQLGDFAAADASVLTRADADSAIRTMDFAIQQVSGLRSELGAVQNRFEATIANLQVGSENLSAARSRIQDTDFAQETAELTRAQILQQAGTSILSQANAVPQTVLGLLQ
ncbi:flagellin N-terminal helical domain-containing protein [Natronospira proteinivora]|nr:flagellin [Natronospira proteinivora]